MAPGATTFFNLPSRDASKIEKAFFDPPHKHNIQTNWKTFEDQPMTTTSVMDVFANRTPVVREQGFLTPQECERMLQIVKTHELGCYDLENTWPRVGTAGITQYDHIKDKDGYFARKVEASSLLARWSDEAGIDILDRVITRLHQTTGMPVRLARDGEKEYFAGILRAVSHGIQVHADYAPYEASGWTIDRIAAQVTWNILLNEVPGGDTLIYDRRWQAPDDDVAWRKAFPRDTYFPQMLEGHPFKAMKAVRGDLTFFNPRNFHEVKACDTSRDHPDPAIRFTVSSFVGFLPSQGSEPATLVLWS